MSDDQWEEAAAGLPEDELRQGPKMAGLVHYDKVERKRVNWLWPGHFPMGKLCLLDGDPDVGKSTVTMDLAARFTTGSPMPDGYMPPCPANVLFLRGEDGAADTVLPRLLAGGGNPARFIELESVPEVTDQGTLSRRPPELPTDLNWLEWAIRDQDVSLVLIDPLMAFLADHINAHRDQQVRRALSPMAMVANRTGACICAVRHLNKTVGAPTLYRGGGSIGLLAAARLVMVAGHDPDNEGRRLLAVYKSNLAVKPETMAYRIVGHDEYECGQVRWEGSSPRSGADLLHLSYVDEDEKAQVDEAVVFLFELLAGEPVPAAEVMRQARQCGIGERALDRAKRVAGVDVKRENAVKGKTPRWLWHLPDPDTLPWDEDPHGKEPDG